MIKFCQDPIFILGLLIRVFLIFFLSPTPIAEWYVPFMESSVDTFSLDPWSIWINSGGALEAFPYGYAMWLFLYPFIAVFSVLGLEAEIGYYLSLLSADFLLLFILHKLLPGREKLLLVAYWCSPIIILASYAYGLNDIIPALFLGLSILYLRRSRLYYAGFFLATAISAKLSMVIAAPFFIVYLLNNKSLRQLLKRFFIGFSTALIIFWLPFLLSSSAMQMLLGNPELTKFLSLSIAMTEKISIYALPLLYVVGLYLVWRLKRQNFELFMAINGIVFLVIVLFTPSSSGWFIWTIPFMVFYQAVSGRLAIIIVGLFSTAFILTTWTSSPVQLASGQLFDIASILPRSMNSGLLESVNQTLMLTLGILLVIRMWRESINRNDFFRLTRKPFAIGIAGDSGSGKDTFATALTDLFGGHSVVSISGDDYHLWDRQKPMWHMMTNLNPMANDLEGFSKDLIELVDGKAIQSRHYDHSSGKMSRPHTIKSNDFIIASGLHALYLPLQRDCFNLRIYLDIDEGLRRHFKMKRDVVQRGHSISSVLSAFERREPDSEKFIRPQKRFAELNFCLQPIHQRQLDDLHLAQNLRLKLVVIQNNGLSELNLNKILISLCGLHVDVVVSDGGSEVQTTIEGDASASDIALAAKMVCPNMFDFLYQKPIWSDGVTGIMQLVTLNHINQLMTKRFLQ